MRWWEQAKCLNADPARWDDGPLSIYHLQTCGHCPVRRECAADALDHNDRATIRAGVDLTAMRSDARKHRLQAAM